MVRLFWFFVDLFMVILCLPMYAVTIPVMIYVNRWAAGKIAMLDCPACQRSLNAVMPQNVRYVPRELGTSTVPIDWERKPSRVVLCPSCSEQICFDRNFRPTACDGSDAIIQK